MMLNQIDEALPSQLDRIQQRSLIVGVVALLLSIGGAFLNPSQFFQSYLLAYLFWTQLALGCLALLMIYHVTGGGWGFVIRRLLEAGMMTLPLQAVLFVPLLFGMPAVYLWARPDAVAQSELLQHKSPYLNTPFFGIRTALYFAIWIGLAYLLNKWSREQDQTTKSMTGRFQRLSGPGLALFGLSITFASFDWMMSLEPDWFSTIYGFIFAVGAGGLAFAFVVPLLAWLSKYRPLSAVVSTGHFNDLGNFLLASVMLWAYMALSQYLIIWSGNLPDEITWYIHRTRGGWQWISLGLILFHFALPFLVLLSRGAKRSPRVLTVVAGLIIFMRLVEVFWLVTPAFHQTAFHLHWLDLVITLGLGGIWGWVFLWQLRQKSLVALNDPRLQEIVAHGQKAPSHSY